MLTKNQKKVLRLLAVSYHRDYSINEIARMVGISPNGAYKILKTFEKEGILGVRAIAHIKSYRLLFENEHTVRLLALAFSDRPEGRAALRSQDLQRLKSVTKACVIFGSYITKKANPEDLDVLFVLDKENFAQYQKQLTVVQDITPVKIHDVIQTTEDLHQNLRKYDPIVIDSLRGGVVLWGTDIVVQVIMDAYR